MVDRNYKTQKSIWVMYINMNIPHKMLDWVVKLNNPQCNGDPNYLFLPLIYFNLFYSLQTCVCSFVSIKPITQIILYLQNQNQVILKVCPYKLIPAKSIFLNNYTVKTYSSVFRTTPIFMQLMQIFSHKFSCDNIRHLCTYILLHTQLLPL